MALDSTAPGRLRQYGASKSFAVQHRVELLVALYSRCPSISQLLLSADAECHSIYTQLAFGTIWLYFHTKYHTSVVKYWSDHFLLSLPASCSIESSSDAYNADIGCLGLISRNFSARFAVGLSLRFCLPFLGTLNSRYQLLCSMARQVDLFQ